MTNKEKYSNLCQTEGSRIPLFLQYWWMEAVCEGKQWDVALAYRHDDIIAAMPYLIGSRLGMRYILQPQLTQFSGPWYRYPAGNLSEQQRLAFEQEAAHQLWQHIASLRLASYQQCFSPQVTNWLPFYWAGCTQTTRYTYLLPDISNPEQLLQGFDRDERQKKILKLLPITRLVDDITPQQFALFHNDYWSSRGQRDLLSPDFIVRVCNAACSRGQGLILGLADQQGTLLAARFVVFDDRCAHSLLSALNPGSRVNGATETLIYRTIQILSDHTQSYDFEGSMNSGIEHFYRSFGTLQTPYFQVSRTFNFLFPLLAGAYQRLHH